MKSDLRKAQFWWALVYLGFPLLVFLLILLLWLLARIIPSPHHYRVYDGEPAGVETEIVMPNGEVMSGPHKGFVLSSDGTWTPMQATKSTSHPADSAPANPAKAGLHPRY